MSDPTLPESTEDSGLTRFHSESLNDNGGILTAENSLSVNAELLKRWENRLQRILTKLANGDEIRAISALEALKSEIRGTREGVSL